MQEKFLIIGSGGREAAFAMRLSRDGAVVHAVMGHGNPTIIDCTLRTGGDYIIGDVNNGNFIVDYVLKRKIDYVFVNADAPLANGVVDILLAAGIQAIGPTREAARIEWDKIYSIETVKQLAPELVPAYRIVSTAEQIESAVGSLQRQGLELVVKPQGLTGGKGVKVMGEHLADYDAVKSYAGSLLDDNPEAPVLLAEKLTGIEFTLMAITDSEHTVFAPATYDYPYRYAGDTGPGTGGMGCFTGNSKYLPFMSPANFSDCCAVIDKTLQYLRGQGHHFNGVMNGGFFLTAQGVKFMEFNSRFGDPEAINILSILDSPFPRILKALYHGDLSADRIKFLDQASVVKYLVSPDYPARGEPLEFQLPVDELDKAGISSIFSAAVAAGPAAGSYRSVGSSRVVALSCIDDSIARASDRINDCLDTFSVPLDYRKDIGSAAELERLASLVPDHP